jgi:predicted DNA-binding protein with PD1-like motif
VDNHHHMSGGSGLATTRHHATHIHVLRLVPGDDLLLSIREFVQARRLRAAFILTCVGSIGRCRLRPAGVAESRAWEDRNFEIVSLTGTMECNELGAAASEHLHLAVSDDKCNTFGGHVVPGCIVRTTAEIVVGVGEGLTFRRTLDERSGYAELFVEEEP